MNNSNLVIIKCPQCGQRLSFKPVPNFRQRSVTCPKCHFSGKVEGGYEILSEGIPDVSAAPQTPAREERTFVIRCNDTNEEYPLTIGVNTIGRRVEEPVASIVFEDLGRYMSRLHASITVNKSGNEYIFELSDDGSSNGTFISGQRMPAKSIVQIMPNEEFKMGKLHFEIKERKF